MLLFSNAINPVIMAMGLKIKQHISAAPVPVGDIWIFPLPVDEV